jgi:PAS domain S-box-containing protein
MTSPKHPRWSYSWLVGLIVGMTAVVVLTGILGLKLFEERLVKSEGENLALIAVDITEKFNLLLVGLHGDLQLLGDTASRVAWDRKRWAAHLHSVKTAYPHYQSLALIGPTGRVLAATDEATIGVDVSGDKWFNDVMANQTGIQVSDVNPNELSQGIETVSVAVPFHTDSGTGARRFKGAVVGLMGVPMLEEIMTRTLRNRILDQNMERNLEYQVMNKKGNLFIDSDLYHKGLVNLMTIGQASARLALLGKAGYLEEEHLRRHVQVITGYAQFIGTKEQSNIHWGVLVRVDRQAVLAPLRSVLWKIGLVSGFLVLPMLAIFLWVVRQLEQTRKSRQRTQAKLEESYTFLQSTLDALDAHIAILDEQGTIVAVNGMWRQFADENQSSDPHHMVGKNYLQICDIAEGACSEEAKEVAKGIRALLQGVHNSCVFEYPCHGRAEQRWFMVRISRFDLTGTLRLVVAHYDVTENKLAVQSMRQISETTRLVISNAMDAHIMIDEQGSIVDWNAQAEKIFGWSEDEAMGRRMFETITPPQYREVYERDWWHFQIGSPESVRSKRIELLALDKEGRQFPIEVSLILVEKRERHATSVFVRDLTERKRAELEQTRLLTVLNASLNEIYVFAIDTLRFTYVNRSALDNLGYTLQDMRAMTPIDIKPEMTDASFRKLLNPLLTGEQSQRIHQTLHRRRNGSTYWVEAHLQVVGEGEERSFLALIYDITERKQEEHRQATLYTITRLLSGAKSLEEAAPYIMETICQALNWNVGALWKVDEGAQTLRCAEVWDEKTAFTSFIECSRQNCFAIGVGLPGRVWKSGKVEWILDVGADRNFPRIAAATSAGLHAAFAFLIGSRDRPYGVMEFFAITLREPDQKLLDLMEGLAGQMSGFLERKQSEQSLNNAKNKAEAAARERAEILAAVEAFFICVNGEGAVTTWTPRAEAIFGISLKQALGRPFTELPIQWSWKEVIVAMEQANDTINSIRVEKIRLVRQNEKEIYLKLTVSPICDDRGVTYIFMGEDISDRLALEHDLVQAQKLESIGHLAAGIAHEINTPTQFVGDNVRFLSDSFSDIAAVLDRHHALMVSAKTGTCAPDLIDACEAESRRADLGYLMEEIPKAIAQSTEGVTRIASIVRAMKEFAHPGSDEKVCVDLNKAIESTLTVARNEWKYIADLTTDLAPDLPLVPCLLGQFNQVILNMIVNATHAIADVVKGTGAKGTISIATRSVNGWAEVRITDSGTGIPEEIRGKIFDPFFTTKEVGKGTGQGLAIAHSVIVDKHHGTIWIESEVGQGTTFIVRLPLDLRVTTTVAEMAA